MVRRIKRPRRKPHELPKHLKGVQGRAMLLRAQGHTEVSPQLRATEICRVELSRHGR